MDFKPKYYLVGGAVRDELLGIPIKERDWVVVGATVEYMKSLNFKKVGRSFPVFLHPKTQEEYALARKEFNSGSKHTDFRVEFSPDTTIEEDLKRRDLTINAIAKDKDNNIIDPYNGIEDINNRILRCVSEAFEDDPLRVLRASRFKSTKWGINFNFDKDTYLMIKKMVHNGKLLHLSKDRIWKETLEALNNEYSIEYFKLFFDFGCMESLYRDPYPYSIDTIDFNIIPQIDITLNAQIKYGLIFYYINKQLVEKGLFFLSKKWTQIFSSTKNFSNITDWLEGLYLNNYSTLTKAINCNLNETPWHKLNIYDYRRYDYNSIDTKMDIIIELKEQNNNKITSTYKSEHKKLWLNQFFKNSQIKLSQDELIKYDGIERSKILYQNKFKDIEIFYNKKQAII